MIYSELKIVRKKLDHLEDMLTQEEKLSDKELKELDILRTEALKEHKKKETIDVSDL